MRVPLIVCASGLALLLAAAAQGEVTVRRLTRAEYDFTVADALGTALRPAADFPPEDSTFGFDNVAASLTVSPLQARLYDVAARAVVEDAFARGALPGCAPRPRCEPEALARFAARVWRRPISQDERASLRRLHAHAGRVAFQAILMSPHFLFRLEAGPWQRASRLSYFLWSSLPDEALVAAAAADALGPGELRAQAQRLLDDPRASRFVDGFAGQWLSTRLLDGHYVDKGTYGHYDEELVISMKRETALFVGEFLREPLPLPLLLTADFTYLDGRLARHYGIAPPPDGAFTRVVLTTRERGGLLGQASVLTATSHASRTGVVKRGQWVLGQLLCDEPPPAPPGVPALPSTKQVEGSQRDRLEEHRAEVRCASCHKVMDAIGFGLENYDGIGAWRTQDGKWPIDASGRLPGGVEFDGARALSTALARDPRFPRCLAERLFTYALGRPPERHDPAIQTMLGGAAEPTLRGMILDLVGSAAFQGAR